MKTKTTTLKAYTRLKQARDARPLPAPPAEIVLDIPPPAFPTPRQWHDVPLHMPTIEAFAGSAFAKLDLADFGISMPPEPKAKKPKPIPDDSARIYMLADCAEMFEVTEKGLLKAIRKLRAKRRKKGEIA